MGESLSNREKYVLHALSEADGPLKTRECLGEVEDYDADLNYGKQISRVYDDLEARGLVETWRGEADDPLPAPRFAELTPAGEREAAGIELPTASLGALDDAEDAINDLWDEVDALSSGKAERDDVARIESRLDDLEERVEEVDEKVVDTIDTLFEVETNVNSDINDNAGHLDDLENRVGYIEAWKENVDEVLQSRVRPAVEFVRRNWLDDSRTSAGDSR